MKAEEKEGDMMLKDEVERLLEHRAWQDDAVTPALLYRKAICACFPQLKKILEQCAQKDTQEKAMESRAPKKGDCI